MKNPLKGMQAEDLRAALALVYTGAMLTVMEFWFLPTRIQARLDAGPRRFVSAISLEAGVTWSVACIVGYAVVPAILVLLVHRSALSSVGWRFRGFARHLPVYLGLFVLMLPALFWAASRPAFLGIYPFVSAARRSLDVWLWWEAAYLAQFFALEAFFRGYLLFTLEKRMGTLAAFVMAVPYCMIHFHKPPLEALGALGAGVILGLLALRYRSWLGGAILHSLVAVSMDALAARKAGLF